MTGMQAARIVPGLMFLRNLRAGQHSRRLAWRVVRPVRLARIVFSARALGYVRETAWPQPSSGRRFSIFPHDGDVTAVVATRFLPALELPLALA